MTNEQVDFFRICSAMARAQADIVDALKRIHQGEVALADAHRRYQASKDAHDGAMIRIHAETPIKRTPNHE